MSREYTKELYQWVIETLDKHFQLNRQMESELANLKLDCSDPTVRDLMIEKLLQHFKDYHPLPLFAETDLQGNILYANEEFIRLSKYTASELIGKNINILRSSRMESGLFTDMWNHLKAGKPWRGELQNRAKDYNTYWIDTFICPVLDESGNIIKYWSVAFDITSQMLQKDKIEAFNQDVLESLKYARRIQKTILPSKKAMDEELNDYFVLYKPKDVVSGDFYWFNKTIDRIYVAVVDCTGHGVPGAFMSLIGYNLLNQIVLQQHIHRPGDILTELHRQVRATLRQDEDDALTQDGMDVCLCAISRFGEEVEYAGAKRPLYWVHNNQLIVIEADKMSIGGEQMEQERVFKTHILEIESGDVIYLFSDGFVDQLGGPQEKKFSTKQLKALIENNHQESMNVQKALFNIVWKDWRGDGEQIDDVTMIGIRL
ncbi:MAG: SpoIIE family protein phosphatase [Bacteroidia bacterium]|nr:SpoIIE family protein phosphatase [Bacteroidia bacterium]MDW8159789.1 SpoIIE family protein phosphatase [Bacteroidia bacterium]